MYVFLIWMKLILTTSSKLSAMFSFLAFFSTPGGVEANSTRRTVLGSTKDALCHILYNRDGGTFCCVARGYTKRISVRLEHTVRALFPLRFEWLV